jgi:hypothetical protein
MINYYNYPHTNLALPARYGGASHYPHDIFISLSCKKYVGVFQRTRLCGVCLQYSNYNYKLSTRTTTTRESDLLSICEI